MIVTITKALGFENILSLCLCDLSTSVRHYRKSSNFTKLLRAIFDLKNLVLKMDLARRNNALSRGISLDTPGEVPVNDFRPLIL